MYFKLLYFYRFKLQCILLIWPIDCSCRKIHFSRCEFLGCMSFGVHHILTKQKVRTRVGLDTEVCIVE